MVYDQLRKESEKQLVETEEGRGDERSWRRHEEEDGESWEEKKGRRGEGWGGGDRPLWWERREEEAALDRLRQVVAPASLLFIKFGIECEEREPKAS